MAQMGFIIRITAFWYFLGSRAFALIHGRDRHTFPPSISTSLTFEGPINHLWNADVKITSLVIHSELKDSSPTMVKFIATHWQVIQVAKAFNLQARKGKGFNTVA